LVNGKITILKHNIKLVNILENLKLINHYTQAVRIYFILPV